MIFDLSANSGEPYKVPVLNAAYPANDSVVFNVAITSKVVISTAGNPATYTYQWYKNGSAVSGATSASYTFTPGAVGTTTLYCKVTNAAGTVTSRTATITANPLCLFQPGMTSGITSIGWVAYYSQTAQAPNLAYTSAGATLTFPTDGYGGLTGVGYLAQIDLSAYSKITLDLTVSGTILEDSSTNANAAEATGLFVWSEVGTGYYIEKAAAKAAIKRSTTTVTVDISKLSGKYYIGVGMRQHGTVLTITVKNVRLS